MIKLTGYIAPQVGAKYTTSPIWVNPRLITHMSTYEAHSARPASGPWDSPKIPVTSICFAAAFQDEQIGVSVMETPEQINTIIAKAVWDDRWEYETLKKEHVS